VFLLLGFDFVDECLNDVLGRLGVAAVDLLAALRMPLLVIQPRLKAWCL